MPFCKGRTTANMPCKAHMVLPTGYCIKHDPDKLKTKEYLKEKEDLLVARERDLELREGMITSTLELSEICETVGRIQDIESLRNAELAIIQGLIMDKIDPKAGGPVAALLKHHADLLKADKPEIALKDEERKVLIQISASLSTEEAWALVQDFQGGMKRLVDRAKQEAIVVIPENRDENNDIYSVCAPRLEAGAGSEAELLQCEAEVPSEVLGADSADTE